MISIKRRHKCLVNRVNITRTCMVSKRNKMRRKGPLIDMLSSNTYRLTRNINAKQVKAVKSHNSQPQETGTTFNTLDRPRLS